MTELKRTTEGPSFLLYSLVLVIVLSPLLDDSRLGSLLLRAGFSVVTLAAVWVYGRDRKRLYTAIILAVPGLGGMWLTQVFRSREAIGAALFFAIVFLLYVSTSVVGGILRADRVGRREIEGALAVYGLLGLVWAFVFALVEVTVPGSFTFTSASTSHTAVLDGTLFGDFFYLSYTTLTTLGYGDMTPVSQVARVAAVTEAIVGQVFLAVLIARLVGLQTARLGGGSRSED